MPTIKQTKSRTSNKKIISKTRRGILGRIAEVDTDEDAININIYGRSGTGKTTLWATFPKPILCILTSPDTGELKSLSKENRKGIKQVSINTMDELFEVTEHVKTSKEYKTVVLEHLTDYQNIVLKEILGLDELPTQLSWGLATQQQYGQCSLKVKESIQELLTLPCYSVIVAQEREFNIDSEQEVILSPYVASAVSPSVVHYLNAKCDYIVQTYLRQKTETKKVKIGGKIKEKQILTNEVEYCLRTGPDPVFITKFRVPKEYPKPHTIVNPTFTAIKKIILGTK